MLKRILPLLAVTLLLPQYAWASSPYVISPDSIYKHIVILASDSLEGREVGEPGEWKAALYIISVFEPLGLEQKGDSGSYLQSFDFIKRIDNGPNNHLTINGQELVPGDDFIPLDHSGNMTFHFDQVIDVGYGIINDDSSWNDYENKEVDGKAVLVRRYSPPSPDTVDANADTTSRRDTTFEKYSSLTNKILTALDNNVSGVFFYTPENHEDTIISRGITHVAPKNIPIVFLKRRGLEKLGFELVAPEILSAIGETDLIRVRDTGYNVVGYLPGQTDTTIIIGAHYDHLGWGGPASRYSGKEKKIHRGADDNGSGVATILELARHFQSRHEQMRHSLLFIAFSGEESGLLGSSHYVRNWTINRNKTLMMINIDMVGRLRDQEKGLAVMGVGTCLEFSAYFDSLNTGNLKITQKESGTGPSDHTAFYNDSVPSLFFFTGAHQDYHTPDDVVEKIDFDGVATVANLITGVVSHFDACKSPLVFQRTKDDNMGRRRSAFSVTLGIMPDFISEIQGLGVDGVSPERPADHAGILKGDIIIGIGDIVIDDIYAYMNALGKFRKGDSTEVTVVRDNDTLNLPVVF